MEDQSNVSNDLSCERKFWKQEQAHATVFRTAGKAYVEDSDASEWNMFNLHFKIRSEAYIKVEPSQLNSLWDRAQYQNVIHLILTILLFLIVLFSMAGTMFYLYSCTHEPHLSDFD